MNWLGMLVDLTHVRPTTMDDALRVTRGAGHLLALLGAGVCDVPRNVPDDILRRLPKNGGVVMVTFVPGFIVTGRRPPGNRSGRPQQSALARAIRERPEGGCKPRSRRGGRRTPRRGRRSPQVADHIDHIRKVAGIDHIGLGSDFDGVDQRRRRARGRVEVSRPDGGAAATRLHRRRHQEDPRPERAARDASGRSRLGETPSERGPIGRHDRRIGPAIAGRESFLRSWSI